MELDIESFDVLWAGQGEIQENTYFFNEDTENRIKAFVEAGGIMVTVNQDSDGGNPSLYHQMARGKPSIRRVIWKDDSGVGKNKEWKRLVRNMRT